MLIPFTMHHGVYMCATCLTAATRTCISSQIYRKLTLNLWLDVLGYKGADCIGDSENVVEEMEVEVSFLIFIYYDDLKFKNPLVRKLLLLNFKLYL